jgi:hypothetical protein
MTVWDLLDELLPKSKPDPEYRPASPSQFDVGQQVTTRAHPGLIFEIVSIGTTDTISWYELESINARQKVGWFRCQELKHYQE